MGKACLEVAGEVLRGLAHFPQDCVIEGHSGPVVSVMVQHASIPEDAEQVVAIMRSVHGVTIFDRFDVVKSRAVAA